MYCAVKDHNGHNHDTVKKMVSKHKEELKKICASFDRMITCLSDTRDNNIEKMRKKIKQQGDDISRKVDRHYDRMIQQMIGRKEQLKQEACNIVSQKIKLLQHR